MNIRQIKAVKKNGSSASTSSETVTNADFEIKKLSESDINKVENTDEDEDMKELEVQEVPGPDVETEKYTKANDIGLWTALNTDDIADLIQEGPENYQHRTGPFLKSKQ